MNRLLLLTPFALLLGQGYLRPEEPSRIFAAGPKEAYYMEPPELASRAYARKILWTADGSNLIVERLVPPPGTSPIVLGLARETPEFTGMDTLEAHLQLVAWNRRSGTFHVLVDLDPAKARLIRMVPMAGSDRLVLTLDEVPPVTTNGPRVLRKSIVLVAAGSGASMRLLTEGDPSVNQEVQLSPKLALGEIVRQTTGDVKGLSVAYFGPDGPFTKFLPVPEHASPSFAADGTPGMAVRGKTTAGKPTYRFYRFDPTTGRLGDLTTESGYEAPDPTPAKLAVLASTDAHVQLKVADGKPEEIGLVTSDGSIPVLSPKDDAVAYLSGGNAYVRTLVKVDRKTYDLAMVEAAKQRSIEYAKEAGTALSMYSQDADDAFPPGGFSIPSAVGPYVRDVAALQAFVYTFAGGVASGDKGATPIGYVSGPGGRALVYADGSVKWKPDVP